MNQLERTAVRYRMLFLLVSILLVSGLWIWSPPHGLAQEIPGGTHVNVDGSEAPNGISVQTLTPELARWLDIPTWTRGVVVSAVDAGSPWADAGLQRTCVIQEANGHSVANEREFRGAVSQTSFEPLLLLVKRGRGDAQVTEVWRD